LGRMKNTNSYEDLGRQIEQLVAGHIAASRRAAQEAVERALAAAGTGPAVVQRRVKPLEGRKRRASADVAALGERFYRAVCAKPGETMTVLAGQVGASARELHRSVTLLRQAGRVRCVGNRHQTRYFPTTKGAVAAA
jgi:hypothetical protein